jgi:hypothetical protein
MAHRTQQTAESRLRQFSARVREWRLTRQKISPMPAELWTEATALAYELDVNTVRLAAGIDYGALRRRVDAGHGTSAVESADAPRFVELDAAAVFGAAGSVLELTDATGTRLRVRLAAGSTLDLGRLIESFRGRS